MPCAAARRGTRFSPEATAADNDLLDLLAVDHIVRSCLLGEVAPHPIPDLLEQMAPVTIAQLSMKWFGCEARYGALVSALAGARGLHWRFMISSTSGRGAGPVFFAHSMILWGVRPACAWCAFGMCSVFVVWRPG